MATTSSLVIERTGGPEVLTWKETPLPVVGTGQARVRHTVIGLNFIDTYHRSGLYPLPLPATIGSEAAGVIEEVGEGVNHFVKGDRVGYCTAGIGAYTEQRVIPVDKLIKLPDSIDDALAASVLLKGLTAEYLVRRTYEVKEGNTVLIHAAAGGTGSILVQWAKHLGATVIGTVGSEGKAKLAIEDGADHVIFYRTEDVAARVREITGGVGVHVVYDGVGKDTFMSSLDSLRPRGLLASFGNASGPVPPLELLKLGAKGSLYVTRPSLMHYSGTPKELKTASEALFDVLASGAVAIRSPKVYKLRDAEQAHRDLEARITTGSTVLLP